jgi:hypothetical protein
MLFVCEEGRRRGLPGAMRERRSKGPRASASRRGKAKKERASLPTSWYKCGGWCKIGSTLGRPA